MNSRRALRAALRIAACLVAVLAAAGSAAPLESTTFDLVRAWFDDDTVYVKYRRTLVRKAAFSLAIRGKVVETKTATFILTVPRAGLSEVLTSLRLEGGEPADDIEYLDRDFIVTRRQSMLTVKGHDAQSDLAECILPYWWNFGLARIEAGLFVCGSFVDPSGRVLWQLSPSTIRTLTDTLGTANQRTPDAVARAAPVMVATFAGNRLMIVTDWTSVKPAEIQIATVDPGQPDLPRFASSRMAAQASYFGLLNARPSYSPTAGYVVNNGPKTTTDYAFCDATRCTRLPLSGRYAYLLVDGARRVAYRFEQANTSVSVVRIGRVEWQ